MEKADQRGRDIARARDPVFHAGPSASGHQISQRLADCFGTARRERPAKPREVPVRHRHQDKPRTQLRNSDRACLNHPKVSAIAQPTELRKERAPVVGKFCRRKTRDIFQQDRAGLALFDQSQGFRKQIPFIIFSELSARDRKRRAGHAAGEKIHPGKIAAIDVADIGFQNPPARLIQTQGGACRRVDFDRSHRRESSLMQSECLASGSCANFKNSFFCFQHWFWN